jgi:hypothetical protein
MKLPVLVWATLMGIQVAHAVPQQWEWTVGTFDYVGHSQSPGRSELKCPETLEVTWTGDALAGQDPSRPPFIGRWLEVPQVGLGVQDLGSRQIQAFGGMESLTYQERRCRDVLGLFWSCIGQEWQTLVYLKRTPDGFNVEKSVFWVMSDEEAAAEGAYNLRSAPVSCPYKRRN